MTRRGRKALDGLADDLRDHIERQTEENLARGMTPDEARRQARLALGNTALIEEDTRAVWVSRWLEDLRRDLRYALRIFRRSPGFAATAVVSLAVGIAAATGVFSIVNAALLNPFPFALKRPITDSASALSYASPRLPDRRRDAGVGEAVGVAHRQILGEFNRSLQQLYKEKLQWVLRDDVGLIAQGAARSVHQVVRRQDAVNIDKRSGRRSRAGVSSWDAALDGRIPTGWHEVVPREWRHAADQPDTAFGTLSVFC